VKPAAEMLSLNDRKIRFRSIVNGRVFSFERFSDGRYQLSELQNLHHVDWRESVLYRGMNAAYVMYLIFIEVHALPSRKVGE